MLLNNLCFVAWLRSHLSGCLHDCFCSDFTGDSSLLCGGLLSSPYGTIQSPNFPSSYLVSSPCVWLLAVEEADMQQFLFNYLTFDVEDSDLVQVFSLLDGGEWVLNISRSGLCIDGNVSCPCTDQSYFLGHRFYVVFTSADSTVGSRFEISYSSLGRLMLLYMWLSCSYAPYSDIITSPGHIATTCLHLSIDDKLINQLSPLPTGNLFDNFGIVKIYLPPESLGGDRVQALYPILPWYMQGFMQGSLNVPSNSAWFSKLAICNCKTCSLT